MIPMPQSSNRSEAVVEARVIAGKTWLPFGAGLLGVYVLFEASARWLGSDRGQAGWIVGALVVSATLLAERLFLGEGFAGGLRVLGVPAARGIAAAAGTAALLLLVVPVYADLTHAELRLVPGWVALLPGLFAQAGIAEEILFRGYLFGHLRRGRTFWRAALLATGPFVLVHFALLLTMPWTVAAASILLAATISFPLAHLFELGGRTVWAPALVHWVVQSVVKVIALEGTASSFAVVWIVASAALPFVVFLVPRDTRPGGRAPES